LGSNSEAEELSASEKRGKDSGGDWIWGTENGYTEGEAGAIGENVDASTESQEQ
jgi:hypothetical protein